MGYVLIQGLGLNQGGLGATRYFASKGKDVIVTDLKKENELASSLRQLSGFKNIKYVLGDHRKKDFENADLVIANPGIPPTNEYIQASLKRGIPVYTEVSYFFANKRCKTVGITGTRGKSTTTNLIYHILKKGREDVFLSGNIGISAIELLDKTNENSIVVIELSSFMLEWMRMIRVSPEYAVVTNIMRDHLNRHKTMEEYVDVKSTIFRFQGDDGVLVTNLDNLYTKSFKGLAKGKVITYSTISKYADYMVEDDDIFYKGKHLFTLPADLNNEFHPLGGKHNKYNIVAAVALVRELGIDLDRIEMALINYKGLYGRQMYMGNIRGRDIVNDTCSTIPDAVIAALDRFNKRRVVLITGGTDKDLKFGKLAKNVLRSNVCFVVVIDGTASRKLVSEFEKCKFNRYKVVESLQQAVEEAFTQSKKGDLILFSPGAASFELFDNEFDRGEKFDTLIELLKNDK